MNISAFSKTYEDRIVLDFPGMDLQPGKIYAIIGANGISETAGLTTHANTEIVGKKLAFDNAKTRIMICDDSKVNIVLDHQIAAFSDEFTLISNKNPILEDMQTRYPGKIQLV